MNKTRSNLLLIFAAFIWGSSFVAQSEGMNYIGPFTFGAVRYLLGALVLSPVAYLSLKNHSMRHDSLSHQSYLINSIKGGLLCGVTLAIAGNLQQVGMVYTTADKAGFLTSLYIVIVPLLGILSKKKVSLLSWCSVFLAIAGFYLLCIKENTAISKGDILLALCAVSFSLQILVVDRYASIADAFLMSMIQFLVAGGCSAILMIFYETPTIMAISASWLPICYSGILSCGVAYTIQFISQRYSEPATASLLMSLESVFAALSAWLIQHTTLTPKELCGCLLIFLAVILSQIPVSWFRKVRKQQMIK